MAMKKISILDKQTRYVTPTAVAETFEPEGLLCGSVTEGGFGAGGFEGDEDGDIDFF
jgi:hypothetical protein